MGGKLQALVSATDGGTGIKNPNFMLCSNSTLGYGRDGFDLRPKDEVCMQYRLRTLDEVLVGWSVTGFIDVVRIKASCSAYTILVGFAGHIAKARVSTFLMDDCDGALALMVRTFFRRFPHYQRMEYTRGRDQLIYILKQPILNFNLYRASWSSQA